MVRSCLRMKKALYCFLACCGLVLVFSMVATPSQDYYSQQRLAMLEAIRQDTTRTSSYTGVERISEEVMDALEKVQRHHFVPDFLDYMAYLNRPLPIGEEQTISQPFIVALMTHLLAPGRTDNVLEIGTGSGYQAAVLAELVESVVTIEIIPSLAEQANQRLKNHGFNNVKVITGDGSFGWEKAAPYDKIIVTAASEKIPGALLAQLKAPGLMVIPVGAMEGGQELLLVKKSSNGEIAEHSILPVRFVPFTGQVRNRN